MFRTALIAIVAIATTAAVTTAVAQSASPVRKLAQTKAWEVVRVGEQKVSHCVMGVRSDAAAPQAGKPQFAITADDQFVILRVRAAEWKFDASRDIAVTLATTDGAERQPAAKIGRAHV